MNRNTVRTHLAPGVLVTSIALLLTLWSPTLAHAASFPTPAALVVESTTTTTASLDWKKVTGASGYRVRYATSSNMADAKGAAFKYSNGVITGLRPGTKYWFRIAVAAKSGTGVAQSAYTKWPYPTGTTKAAPPPVGGGYDLDVASFNISGILNDTSKNQPWSERKSKVAQQLLGENPSDQPADAPDVMALQEANTSRKFSDGATTQYTDLVRALNTYAAGSDHYSAIDPSLALNATRIAYNDTTLRLVKAGAYRWTAQETAVDGLRMMAWGIFEVRSTGDRFFFASNHLETASEPIRRQQWAELIKEVPILSDGLPVVFGGDFNSPRKSVNNATASVMLPKMKPAGFGDTLGQESSAMAYVSTSRAQRVVKGNYNSVNKYSRSLGHYVNTDYVGQSVDYLFATNSLAVKRWELVADDGGDYTLDGMIPSDHNLVRATITLP